MATTKRVKRRVIGISASRETSNRGNPRDYWYILECGHVALERHSPRSFIQYMMMKEIKDKGIKFTKFCRNCKDHKEPDKETTINVLGWFRASEFNEELIEMYKKFTQVKPKTVD